MLDVYFRNIGIRIWSILYYTDMNPKYMKCVFLLTLVWFVSISSRRLFQMYGEYKQRSQSIHKPTNVTAWTKYFHLPLVDSNLFQSRTSDTERISEHLQSEPKSETYKQLPFSRKQLISDQQQLLPFLTASWKNKNSLNGTVFNYLKEYRNPCWTEKLPPRVSYDKNGYIKFFRKYDPGYQYKLVTKAFTSMKSILVQRRREGKSWRFRCLPSVYVAGVHKAGKLGCR